MSAGRQDWLAAAGLLACGALGVACAAAPVDPRDNRAVMAPRSLDDLEARADRLLRMLEGEYRGSWPGAFAKLKDGVTVKAWAVWKRVALPAFGSRVLYHEVREGGPLGRILRQRIVVLGEEPDRTHNYMNLYPILDHEPYSRADLQPGKLAALTPDTLPYFGRGCQVNMIGDKAGFMLAADLASCVILYPDGRSRYNRFEIRVQPAGFSFFEAAFDLDGKFLMGSRRPSRFARLR